MRRRSAWSPSSTATWTIARTRHRFRSRTPASPRRRRRASQKPPEGKEREKALDDEKAAARKSLLAKADAAAEAAGHGSYMEMLEGQLLRPSSRWQRIASPRARSPTQRAVPGRRHDRRQPRQEDRQVLRGDAGQDARGDGQAPHGLRGLARGLKFDDWVRSKATSAGEKRDFEIMLQGNYARMSPEKLAEKAAENPRALIDRVKDLEEAARGGSDESPTIRSATSSARSATSSATTSPTHR